MALQRLRNSSFAGELVYLPDLPPRPVEPIACTISAAARYEIPANVLLAVVEKEGGKPGQWVRNTNGTFDVGAMQFNTTYLKALSRYGISAHDVAGPGCYPFELAAWRIRRHIKTDSGDLWTRVSNYHSRTPRYNAIYRADLIKRAAKWADWISLHTQTYEVVQHVQGTGARLVPGIPASNNTVGKTYQDIGSAPSYVPRRIIESARR
jgi:hypothetical protein